MDFNTIKQYEEHIVKFVESNKVVTEQGCWLMPCSGDIGGYGYYNYHNQIKFTQLHRIMFQLKYGEVAKSMVVRHVGCRNRNCVNTAHLAIGTHKQNVEDSILDKTHVSLMRHRKRRLSDSQRDKLATMILSGKHTGYHLSKVFGISVSAIVQYKARLLKRLKRKAGGRNFKAKS